MASIPHFFKVIVPTSLEQKKLMIPKKFVRNYGDFLSNPVYLKLADGKNWEMGLTKSHGKVWLENGWFEFSEYYSLKFGSLLVFKHEANSTFHVKIFEGTGLEMKYPCEDPQEHHESNINEEFKEDESLVILDSFPKRSRKREDESPPSHQCFKKMKNQYEAEGNKTLRESGLEMPNSEGISEDGAESNVNEEYKDDEYLEIPESSPKCSIKREEESLPSHQRLKKMRNESSHKCEPAGNKLLRECGSEGIPKDEVARRRQPLTALRKADAVKNSRNLESENPSFQMTMRKSNVNGRFNMILPRKFIRKYLGLRVRTITIQDSNGETWSLLCKWTQAKYPYISSGWKNFAEENHLKEGDVCVFELIEKDTFLFTKEESSPIQQADVIGKFGAKTRIKPEVPSIIDAKAGFPSSSNHASARKASDLNSIKPSFVVSILPSHARHCSLNLPSGFVKKYLIDSNFKHYDVILETSDGRKWHAKLSSIDDISQPRVELRNGWRRFAKDNYLKEGDVCIFELSKLENELVINVAIFRLFEDLCRNLPQDLRQATQTQRASSSESSDASDDGDKHVPSNPFFEIEVCATSYYNGSLNLPSSFVRHHLSPSTESVKLQVKKREWKVKVIRAGTRVRFSAGWRAFYKANFLEDGDICVYEMISKKDSTFRVTITKSEMKL